MKGFGLGRWYMHDHDLARCLVGFGVSTVVKLLVQLMDGTSMDGTSMGGTSMDGTSMGGTSMNGTSMDGQARQTRIRCLYF